MILKSMRLSGAALVLVLTVVFLAAAPVAAEPSDKVISGAVDHDLFTAGSTVAVDAAIAGDLVAAGGEVAVSGPIEDGAYLAGGHVAVTGDVDRDVIVAGGQVNVSGAVGGKLVVVGGVVSVDGPVAGRIAIAGGDVELGEGVAAGGNVWLSGGRVTVMGELGRNLKIVAGRVVILAAVAGDVDVTAREVVLGPGAQISGALTVRGPHPAEIEMGAEVLGPVTHVAGAGAAGFRAVAVIVAVVFAALPLLFAFLVGLIAILVFPRFSQAVAARMRYQPVASLGLGALIMFGLPILCLALFFSIVGLPFALLLGSLYVALLVLGLPLAALGLAILVAGHGRSGTAMPRGWIILLYALFLIAFAALSFMPLLGWLVTWLFLLIGIGATVLGVRALSRRPSAAPGAS